MSNNNIDPRLAFKVLWKMRRFLEENGSLTEWEISSLLDVADNLLEQVNYYKEGIVWDTTCLNCASLMSKNYEQYVQLDKIQRVLEGTDSDQNSEHTISQPN